MVWPWNSTVLSVKTRKISASDLDQLASYISVNGTRHTTLENAEYKLAQVSQEGLTCVWNWCMSRILLKLQTHTLMYKNLQLLVRATSNFSIAWILKPKFIIITRYEHRLRLNGNKLWTRTHVTSLYIIYLANCNFYKYVDLIIVSITFLCEGECQMFSSTTWQARVLILSDISRSSKNTCFCSRIRAVRPLRSLLSALYQFAI